MKATRVPALLALCLLLAEAPASAIESDFQAVVGAIETQFGVRRTHIPLFGLASFVVRSSHQGVHGLEFATIENLPRQPEAVRRLDGALRRTLGPEWRPFIQVRSGTRQEYTAVYLRGAGLNVKLMVATLDGDEATVVELRLDAGQLHAWLENPERMARDRNAGAHEQ